MNYSIATKQQTSGLLLPPRRTLGIHQLKAESQAIKLLNFKETPSFSDCTLT